MSFTKVHTGRLPRILAAIVLATGFLANQTALAAAPPELAAKIARLMDASGITHSVRQIQPGMVSGLDTPQQGIPDNVRRALREAASQTFQAEPILERVRASLGSALSGRHIDDALVWYETPVGKRITALENASAEPAAAARIQDYATEIEKRPPSKGRSALIAKLAVATGSSEMNATMVESVVLATALGVNASIPVQKQAPADMVRRQVAASLPELRKQSDQLLTVSLLYTYRTLPDQDLEAYLKFLNSPGGSAFTKTALAGMRDAMLEAMGKFMQAIPKALGRQGPSVGT